MFTHIWPTPCVPFNQCPPLMALSSFSLPPGPGLWSSAREGKWGLCLPPRLSASPFTHIDRGLLAVSHHVGILEDPHQIQTLRPHLSLLPQLKCLEGIDEGQRRQTESKLVCVCANDKVDAGVWDIFAVWELAFVSQNAGMLSERPATSDLGKSSREIEAEKET